jgi:hypothetical protein
MMLGYCLYGLCAFPNMVIHANIARKSEKKGENTLTCTVVEWCLHGLCTFLNIEIIAIKWGKDRDGAHC